MSFKKFSSQHTTQTKAADKPAVPPAAIQRTDAAAAKPADPTQRPGS